jgi:acetolactate synthase-1/2/3 large subunit
VAVGTHLEGRTRQGLIGASTRSSASRADTAILPAYDPLLDSVKVRHILVRHEQGAGHAAEGYAAATGKVGVCMATSGPGATNLVTPIADAYMDSVPIVAITGQVNSRDRHRRLPGGRHPRHHDADHQAQLPRHRPDRDPARHRRGLPHRLDRAPGAGARRHLQGRPAGPDDLLLAAANRPARLPAGDPPHGKQIREAAKLIAAAQRPVLYIGGGVIRSRAARNCGDSSSSRRSRS